MSNPDLLGPWVRRFLLEYLVGERNFAPDHVRQFLGHLEQARACRVTTRNQRLAALHSLARFIGARSPEHLAWCSEICSIPFKKAPHEGVCYLEKHEMDALLDAPDTRTRQGFRDHTVLLFLYNSGARASEAVGVTVGDLDLPDAHQASVRLMGKGSKVRRCPLWASTAGALKALIGDRPTTAAVFVNRRGHPLTRYGVHDLVARYGHAVAGRLPSLQPKRLSPHTCCVPVSTSTPSARGSGTSPWTRPTCTPRSISTPRPRRSRSVPSNRTREAHPSGRTTKTSWCFSGACSAQLCGVGTSYAHAIPHSKSIATT